MPDVIPVTTATTTKQVYPEGTSGYTSYSTTNYQTGTTGTPTTTHYKYDATDKTPHYDSSFSRVEGRSPPRTGAYEETATKIGSDQREGLGTGAAIGTSDLTGTHKTSGWSDTASKTGSDIREGLGSGPSYTK